MALFKCSLLAFFLVQLFIAETSGSTACIQVTLRSRPGRPASQIVRDDGGAVRRVVSVKVWDQISKLPCVDRVNYFYYGNIIIARDGCEATFKVCYRRPEPTTTAAPLTTVQPDCQKIKLLSRKSRPVSRSLDNEVVSMTLLKDFYSKVNCRRGVNFGFDNTVVFASGGCRGIFEVCTSSAAPLTTAPPAARCEEVKILRTTRRTVRDANDQLATITGFELLREFSKHTCREGRNYYSRGSVYVVKNGCKGKFRVCYEASIATAAPLTTTGAPRVICEQVTVRSTPKQRGRVVVTDANGKPVEIIKVKVWDQISKVKCIQWVNYFVSGSTITTRGGCHASFQVCYQVAATTPAPLTTARPPNAGCDFVRLVSSKGRRALVRFPDVTISSMTLVRQFSSSQVDCIRRKTFAFAANKAIARNGCRGLFQICFDTPAPLTTANPETCKHYKVLRPSRISVRDSNSQLASISSVSLEREISKHVCEEGVNYLFRGSRFYVRGGCKGVFRVCYTALTTTAAPLTTTEAPVVCTRVDVKSRGSSPVRVDVTDSNGNSVIIVRVKVWDQISKVKCRRGINFFVARSSIRTKDGCQASFQVCYRPAPQTTPAPLTTVAPETCRRYQVLKPSRIVVRDANSEPGVINSVVLRREISKHVCQEGVNYFYRGPALFVRGGCKGVFRICYSPRATTPAPLTTTEAPVVCSRVDVKSRGSSARRVDITDSDGNSVIIVKVKVWDQLSKVKCQRGVNFFVSTSSITAKDGCQATFQVCYRPAPQTTPAPLTTAAPEICRREQILRPSRIIVRDANSEPGVITRVVLRREISKHVCQEGVNYFFRGPAFIVIGGCKGVFRLCYTVKGTTPAPLTTAAPEPSCKRVNPAPWSRVGGRIDVTDDNGNAVEIVSVKVWDQISKVKCRQGINFFVSGSSIILRKGCRASFRVCYLPIATTPAPLTTQPPETCNNVIVLKHARQVIVGSDGLPAEITRVKLLREISKHVCRRRVNYFFRGSVFIVNGGCKGRFRICFQDNPANPTTAAPLTTAAPIECKIHKVFEPTRKSITDENDNPASITSVRLVREFSKHVCELNTNYFFRESRFVVRPGCKGIFEVCYSEIPAPLTTAAPIECKVHKVFVPTRKSITDENDNPASITSVRLVREFSKHVCELDTNYFFRESRFVVRPGCKGIFEVCYSPIPAPLTTAAPIECKVHKVFEPIRKSITDENDNPASITSVRLVREFSKHVCELNTNYFFRESRFVVRPGCKGIFEVCYSPIQTTPAPLTTAAPEPICRQVTLKSRGDQQARADVTDANGNSVRIVSVKVWDQISKRKCVLWINYFYSEFFIIAKKGCQATFKVCYLPKPQPTTPAPLTTTPSGPQCRRITLEGPDRHEIHDARGLPVIITDLSLVRDFSYGGCKRGSTFRAVGSFVVVNKHCKGVFLVCYIPAPPPTTAAPLTTVASGEVCRKYTLSAPVRRELLDADKNPAEITRMDLVKEVENGKCRRNVNFDFSGSTLSVRGTCKGVFLVCIVPGAPAELTTTAAAPARKCVKISLNGSGSKPNIWSIPSPKGRPIVVKGIELIKEFSYGICKEWVNFFASGNTVVVKKGCHGRFKVCFNILWR